MKARRGCVYPNFSALRSTSVKLLVVMSLALFACKPTPTPEQPCKKDFEKTITAFKIKSGKAHFDIDDLDFLFSQTNLVLTDADLIVSVDGRRSEDIEFDVAFNGTKASRRDGKRASDREDYDDSKKQTHVLLPMHKFFLNGAESFEQYVRRLKLYKGEMRIDFDDIEDPRRGHGRGQCHHGDDIRIVAVKLVFKGYTLERGNNCTATPPPTPIEDPSAYSPRIDSTLPSTTPTSSTNMSIGFSAASIGGTFYCSLDGASPQLCQSPAIYSGLSSRTHTFVVTARTPSGQPATSSASYTWTVDATTPVVTIDNLPELKTLTTDMFIQFAFSASKPNSTYFCSLDGQAATMCSSPMLYPTLSEGSHHFEVTAADSLGNVSSGPTVYDWRIDVTAPSVAITSVTPASAVQNINNKTINFAATETSTFMCSTDGSVFQNCESPLVLGNLSEGSHHFEVLAVDLAGNKSTVISYSWTTDYSAPQLEIVRTIPTMGLTSAQTVSLEFTANENVDFYCAVDDKTDQLCASPFVHQFASEGPHQIAVRAADYAGNQSSSALALWTLDTTAPAISFGTILPSSESNISSSDLSLEVVGQEQANLIVTLNGTTFTAGGPIELHNLGEGDYSLSVFAQDSAGNTSNTLMHAFRVDQTAPHLNLINVGANPTNLDSRSIEFSSDEDVLFECNVDSMGFATCASPLLLTGLANGEHIVIVRATDLAGNAMSDEISWLVDTLAPSTQSTSALFSTSMTFTLSASELGSKFICSLDETEFTPCTNPVQYNNLAPGHHVFVARAIDEAGNIDSEGATNLFYIEPPIQTFITSTAPSTALTNDSSMKIQFSASRAASGFICSLDGADFGGCSTGISFVELADGSHTFVAKAIDSYGVVDTIGATYSWIVDTISPTPSSPLSLAIGVNTITVSWTTNEPATSQLKYGVGGTANINRETPESTAYTTNHSVTLTGLTSNTLYGLQVSGHDQAGNSYSSTAVTARTRR